MTIELPAEVEGVLRREAAARGVSVDSLLQEMVVQFARRAPEPPKVKRVPFRDRSAEMAWALHPDPRYDGQWVALDGDRVLSSGVNGIAVYDAARAQGAESPFMVFAQPRSEEPFVGGWL